MRFGETYSTVSYSMVSFRQMAKILSGELRLLAEAGVAAQFVRELGEKTWRELSKLALTDIRLALRAFAPRGRRFRFGSGPL